MMVGGSHLGGEPCAHQLVLKNYDVGDDYFEFRFVDGAMLSIVMPYDALADDATLVIPRCEYLRLEWYLPDQMPTPQTLCSITFTDENGGQLREEIPPDISERTGIDTDVLVLAPASDV